MHANLYRPNRLLHPTQDGGVPPAFRSKSPASALDPQQISRMLEDRDPRVRLASLEHIAGDVKVLKYVAKNSQFADLRLAAIEKLSGNIEALTDVAKFALSKDARFAALEELEGDATALRYVASNSNFDDVRLAAIEKLSGNVEALKKVVENSAFNKTVVRAALEKFAGNVEVLLYFSDSHMYPSLNYGTFALEMLAGMVKGLTDVQALKKVTMYSPNKIARLAALEKLDGNIQALKDVARYSHFEDVTRLAIKKLAGNVEALTDLANCCIERWKCELASATLKERHSPFVVGLTKLLSSQ